MRRSGWQGRDLSPGPGRLLALPAQLLQPHPSPSTRLALGPQHQGQGRCGCRVFSVGAGSSSPWGALFGGCCTLKSACRVRQGVSSSGGAGRAGSHPLPRERKLGHSSAALSQRKPRAQDVALPEDADAILGGWGCPSSARSLLPPRPECRVWGPWHHQGRGPHGGTSISREKQPQGHASCCPAAPFSRSPSPVPLCPCWRELCAPHGPISGTLGHGLCQHRGGGLGGLCLPRHRTMAQELPAAPASMK